MSRTRIAHRPRSVLAALYAVLSLTLFALALAACGMPTDGEAPGADGGDEAAEDAALGEPAVESAEEAAGEAGVEEPPDAAADESGSTDDTEADAAVEDEDEDDAGDAADARAEDPDACDALLGAWTSAPYRAIALTPEGEVDAVEDLSMRLVVEDAEGCRLSGYHEWGNDERSGTEVLAGVADPDSGELLFLEVGPHPEGGTTGRMWAELEADGRMRLGYLAVESADGVGHAFATRLVHESIGAEPEPLVCEERVGAWTGHEPAFHRIPREEAWTLQEADLSELEVGGHEDCGFHATMRWRYGEQEAEELVIGVMTGEDEAIVQEVGPHVLDVAGSQGPKFLRHGTGGELDIYQVAITGDASEAHAAAGRAHAEGAAREDADCPDLTGSWRSGPFVYTRVHEDGRREDFDRLARELVVAEQAGCVLRGTNRWQDAADEVWHEEPFAGVMDPDAGRLYLAEFPPHPMPGSTALIEERVVDGDTLSTLYVGTADAGSYGDVLKTTLRRAPAD